MIVQVILSVNVPRSTLNDRTNGKVVHGSLSGWSRYLNYIEEEGLIHFLFEVPQLGMLEHEVM